jgi:hypothetical protein
MTLLQQNFPTELELLEDLFGIDKVASSIKRLNEIHAFVEARWHEYVSRIPDGVVKYLLIAEAPPWRATGSPWFVLDPESPNRTLMRVLRRTFLSAEWATHLGAADALKEFARRGFLVIDSIPFSMKYSSRKRTTPQYRKLLERTIQTYLLRKITSPSLSWSPNVQVAFAFKLNATAIMEALDGQLALGSVRRTLGSELIAANGSGFPDARKLRSIFGLS